MTAPHHVIHIILFFTFFFFAKDNPPLTKSDNTITGHFSSLLCHGLSPSAEPGTTQRRGGKVHYSSKKRKKTLPAVLTGEQRPSTSVTHSGSAVRPQLQEPRCSIWEQPRWSSASSPLPISKLTQSSSREDGGKGKVRKRRRCVARKF